MRIALLLTVWLLGPCIPNQLWAQSGEIPEAAFTVGQIKIKKTTLVEVQAQFGKGDIFRGRSEDSPIELCYVYSRNGKNSFIVFETGPMGEFSRVTGFRMTKADPKRNCAKTTVNVAALSTANGISLRLSMKEFSKKFHISFAPQGSSLSYEGLSKREASKEELEKIRAMWPKETQTYFDVTTTIKARFHNNLLVDYYVSQIESY